MRKLLPLLFLTMIFSCQENDLEEYFVPLETCDYIPSPCSLISMEAFIAISGSTPFPTSNTYGVNNTEDVQPIIMDCEMGFADELDKIYTMSGTLRCIENTENIAFTDLSEVSTLPSNSFNSEAAFENAIYYPNINAYIIRQDNYFIQIVFENFTKQQEIDIAIIMLSNLP